MRTIDKQGNPDEGHAVDIEGLSQEELIELAREKGVELTDEQLERVSGGIWASNPDCPDCGSSDVEWDDCLGLLVCRSCGCKFY